MNDSIFKIKWSKMDLYFYFMLIPFIYPKGFENYIAGYESFFHLWLFAAAIVVVVQFCFRVLIQKFKYKKCLIALAIYYILFIFITIYHQGEITSGYQKLFMAPFLGLTCMVCLENNLKPFLRCLSNLFIFNFILQLVVFNPYLWAKRWSDYFSIGGHITFLGHVQIVSQLGIVGIFLSCLVKKLYPKDYVKTKLLLILSILVMIMSGTMASYIALMILLMGAIFYKIDILKRVMYINSNWFVLGWILICLLILYFTVLREGSIDSPLLVGALNGRNVIWASVIKLLKGNWLSGYGAYGVNFTVFWSAWSNDGLGMNYTHCELLQRLLDGGIVLLVGFVVMILAYIKSISYSKNGYIKYVTNLGLLVFLVVMLAESVTEYYFFLIFLSITAFVPEMISQIKED